MGTVRQPGPLFCAEELPASSYFTPEPLGLSNSVESHGFTCQANTPGPVGLNASPRLPTVYLPQMPGDEGVKMCYREEVPASFGAESWQKLVSGAMPLSVGTGMASVVRIPVPHSNGLFIEFSPRGHVPQGGSTSTIFIQDVTGKRHLRLDYGYNKVTGMVDYHWNQKGTHGQFGITDHTTVGKGGEQLYKAGRYFKYAGRTLLVVGVALDAYSIVVAKKRIRQIAKVAAGWGGAWAGCKLVGAGGAAAGTLVEPGGGTAVGGFVGCVVGGAGGYFGASWAAGELYDYVEETYFEPVPEALQSEL